MRERQQLRKFDSALKSFLGHLEGTEKAAHTIQSYRLDLMNFERYLKERGGKGVRPAQALDLGRLVPRDLGRYADWLQSQGLKTNTRRRKLLTLHKFLLYLSGRKRVPIELAVKIPTPAKVERVPRVLDPGSFDGLRARIERLPTGSWIDARNRALLWTLVETGAQVSEVALARFDDWRETSDGEGELAVAGKAPRQLPVSRELLDAVRQLRKFGAGKVSAASPWCFPGFHRGGPLSGPISSRGIELLTRMYAKPLGLARLTPKLFRQSRVVAWHREGRSQDQMQAWLGLKTPYAFRSYAPLMK